MKESGRLQHIELLRVLAMVAVVLTHIGTTASTDFAENYVSWGGVFYLSLVNFFHFAVPIFFMISGALLLNPKKDISIKRLFKRYIVKYVGVLMIFGWGYAFIEEIFTYRQFKVEYLINSFVNMLCGKSWAHMWYMYALVGVTLCIPILRMVVKYFSKEENNYFLIITILFFSIIPFVTNLLDCSFGISFPMGNIYCLYMLLGYWLENEKIVMPRGVAIVSIAIIIPVFIVGAYLKVMKGIDLGVGAYYSPLVAIWAIALFSLIRHKYNGENFLKPISKKIVSFLSGVSFGVYLIHMFWINLLFKFLDVNPFEPNAIVGFCILGILVLLTSILSAWILKKIPLLKKIL